MAKRLHDAYETRWTGLRLNAENYPRIILGSDAENPATLYAHDWHTTNGSFSPWNQPLVKKMVPLNGFWAVHIERAGTYRITLRHQPAQAKFSLQAATARLKLGKAIETLGDIVNIEKPVSKGMTSISFGADLPKGDCFLQTWLDEASGTSRGAYYVEVERQVDTSKAATDD